MHAREARVRARFERMRIRARDATLGVRVRALATRAHRESSGGGSRSRSVMVENLKVATYPESESPALRLKGFEPKSVRGPKFEADRQVASLTMTCHRC